MTCRRSVNSSRKETANVVAISLWAGYMAYVARLKDFLDNPTSQNREAARIAFSLYTDQMELSGYEVAHLENCFKKDSGRVLGVSNERRT